MQGLLLALLTPLLGSWESTLFPFLWFLLPFIYLFILREESSCVYLHFTRMTTMFPVAC